MEKKFCFYKKDRALHKVPLEKVVYIESSDNHVKFHTWDTFYQSRMTFQWALDLLHDEKLVQVHRSYAVFLDHIVSIGSDTVIMHTEKPVEIPVTKKYYRDLMDNILILESGFECGCDVSNVDSEEKYLEWKMQQEDEHWEREQGGEEED